MVRNLHCGPKWIPGVIVQNLGPLSFLIKTRNGQTWRRHEDYLKKLHTDPESENGDENCQTLIAGNYLILYTLTVPKLPSQEMTQDTLILAPTVHIQMNCQTVQRLLRSKPLQEVVLNIIQPEMGILQTISVSELLDIVSPYLSCVLYHVV